MVALRWEEIKGVGLNGKAKDFYAWERLARCSVFGVFYHFVLLFTLCVVRRDI